MTTSETPEERRRIPSWLSRHDFDARKLSDAQQLEVLLDREYSIDDLKSQRKSLLVFLGKPRENFFVLLSRNVTPEPSQQELLAPITEWAIENRPLFPLFIQARIGRLAKFADRYDMLAAQYSRSDSGLKALNDSREMLAKDWQILFDYERLLRLKCLDPRGTISTTSASAIHRPPETASFPTPPDATWEDVTIRFIDGHNIFVRVKKTTGTFEYTQLGMVDRRNAKPTQQWKLLEVFAENDGVLTWKSPKADPKNQKRHELLAKNLRAFLRIEGDPFVSTKDGKGWRARFSIIPVPQDE
jgi:hypothetical protein